MIGVGRHSFAHYLRVYLRAARFGVIVVFEDEACRSFAQHESVAGFGERTAGGLRAVIARRESVQRVETADAGIGHVGIRSARQQHVGMTETNLVKSRTYSMGRRGAGGGNRETRATQPEADGYMSGCDARDGLRNHERIEARHSVAFGEVDDLFFGGLQTAHTASPYHTHAAAVFLPVLLWAGKTGCLSALWEDYILFNFSYTGDAAAQENSILKTALQFAGVVWPGTVAQLICLFFDHRNSRQWLNTLFFAFSLLAAGMSARGYYHYAIILLPAMILPLTGFYDLSGRLWCRLFRKPETVDFRLIVVSFLLIAASAFLYRRISPGELKEAAAVQALLEKTAPEDDVLVLGNNCWYYLASERKTENRFFYQLPPLEISSELYAAFEEDLDRHPPDTVLLPGREEEREWTDVRLKGIREKLLSRSYSSEAFDEFELFTRNKEAS